MAKPTTYSTVKNPMIIITFNQPGGIDGIQFIPAVIEVRMDATTTEGAIRGIVNRVELGNITATPLTNVQIYTQVNKSTTGALISGILKTAFIDALNEDPSV